MFNTLLIFLLSTWINIKIIFLKSEEISRNKMFNPSLLKKKSYYMNFKHKNTSYMPLLVTYVFKVFKRKSYSCYINLKRIEKSYMHSLLK